MTMNSEELAALREHYDNSSTESEMAADGGRWDTDIDPDPMITTSLRLPKSLLDWVREQASTQRTKPTALIRAWIEERRDHELIPKPTRAGDDLVERLERLERAVFDQPG